VASYRDRGVVLRGHPLGEKDRILHLFTEGNGKVRAVAKGVRRPGSRFGGRLEPYGVVDLELHRGRTLDVIQQVEIVESNASLRSDHVRSAAAAVMVELVDLVAAEGEADPALMLQLRSGLAALEAEPDDPSVFVDAVLLRVASVVGFHVFTDACARCRAPGPHAFLSVVGGGTLCADCATAGTRAVGLDVIEAVRLLGARGEWSGLPTLARERPEARRTASSYARAFVEHHLDRRLRSYDAVERPWRTTAEG
jgi:DNA repair protein RecO (recombination protein O)